MGALMGLDIDLLVEARVVEDLLEPVEVAGRDLDLAHSGLEDHNRGHVEMLEDLPARGIGQKAAGRPVKTDAGTSQTILQQHVDESGQEQHMPQGIEARLVLEEKGVEHHSNSKFNSHRPSLKIFSQKAPPRDLFGDYLNIFYL